MNDRHRVLFAFTLLALSAWTVLTILWIPLKYGGPRQLEVVTSKSAPRVAEHVIVKTFKNNGKLQVKEITVDSYETRLIPTRHLKQASNDDEDDDDDLGLAVVKNLHLDQPTSQARRRLQQSHPWSVLLPAILISIATVVVACAILLLVIDWRDRRAKKLAKQNKAREPKSKQTTKTAVVQDKRVRQDEKEEGVNVILLEQPVVSPLSRMSTMTNSLVEEDEEDMLSALELALSPDDRVMQVPCICSPFATKTPDLAGEMILQTPTKKSHHAIMYLSPDETTESRDVREAHQREDSAREESELSQLEYIISSIPKENTPIKERIFSCDKSELRMELTYHGVVLRVYEDSAFHEQIFPGDIIMRINGVETEGRSVLQLLEQQEGALELMIQPVDEDCLDLGKAYSAVEV